MKDKKQITRTSFVLYSDIITHLELLNYQEKGILLEAIYNFANNIPVDNLPPMVKMIFSFISKSMKENWDKWDEKIALQSEFGRRGGRPKKENKGNLTNKSIPLNEKAPFNNERVPLEKKVPHEKKALTVTVTDTVTVTENKNNNLNNNLPSPPSPPLPSFSKPVSEIVNDLIVDDFSKVEVKGKVTVMGKHFENIGKQPPWNFVNSELPPEWKAINISPLEKYGFNLKDVEELYRMKQLTPKQVESSAIELSKLFAESPKNSPKAYAMTILKSGEPYVYKKPGQYQKPVQAPVQTGPDRHDRAMEEYRESQEAAKKSAVDSTANSPEFVAWVNSLTPEQKEEWTKHLLVKNSPTMRIGAFLKKYEEMCENNGKIPL